MDFLELEDYGVKNIESHWYILVVFDIISNFGWTVPLKKKLFIQQNTYLELFFKKTSKRMPSLVGVDDGKGNVNENLLLFQKKSKIKKNYLLYIKMSTPR